MLSMCKLPGLIIKKQTWELASVLTQHNMDEFEKGMTQPKQQFLSKSMEYMEYINFTHLC